MPVSELEMRRLMQMGLAFDREMQRIKKTTEKKIPPKDK
jgi:hypothetical protein